MSQALEKAIVMCGSQAELARRIGGKTRTGHVYYWLRSGVPTEIAPAIELATLGQVRCEELCADVEWTRDHSGRVTGYHVRVSTAVEPATPAQVA